MSINITFSLTNIKIINEPKRTLIRLNFESMMQYFTVKVYFIIAVDKNTLRRYHTEDKKNVVKGVNITYHTFDIVSFVDNARVILSIRASVQMSIYVFNFLLT